jgi:quercetin dioxygenase-like cupin family protein
MHVFSVVEQAEFDPKKHVEKILGTIEAGDVTVACWEPGQISPYHCHPHATEIYFCFEGGGTMRTPTQTVAPRAKAACSNGFGSTIPSNACPMSA